MLAAAANADADAKDAGDLFYPRLLDLAARVSARVVLFEVADMEQAVRVAAMVRGQGLGLGRDRGGGVWDGCEIWRDWPAAGAGAGGEEEEEEGGEVVGVQGVDVRVRGEGNGRAVLAWRGKDGGRMVGKR